MIIGDLVCVGSMIHGIDFQVMDSFKIPCCLDKINEKTKG